MHDFFLQPDSAIVLDVTHLATSGGDMYFIWQHLGGGACIFYRNVSNIALIVKIPICKYYVPIINDV